MSGVQIELTLQGIEAAEARLGRIAGADLADLAFDAGALIESSTQERIATGKASPDGAPWPAWAPSTAARRHGGQSLLVQENHLLTSVQNLTTGEEAVIGSNLVYAAIHQAGGKAGRGRTVTIPARPYLGLSPDDVASIEALVVERLAGDQA